MRKIELPPRGVETLFGVHDQNIKYLESLLDVRINARGQDLSVDGDPKDVVTVEHILEDFSEPKDFTGVDMLRAIRSFDPCMPCTTHIYGGEREIVREVNTCACSAEG